MITNFPEYNNQKEYNDVWKRIWWSLYESAQAIAKDSNLAEIITSETVLKLLEKHHSNEIHVVDSFFKYAHVILQNNFYNFLRAQKRDGFVKFTEDFFSDDRDDSIKYEYPEHSLTISIGGSDISFQSLLQEDQEYLQLLQAIFNYALEFPEMQKEIFMFSWVAGYKPRQIAKKMNLNPRDVIEIKKNILRKLRNKFNNIIQSKVKKNDKRATVA